MARAFFMMMASVAPGPPTVEVLRCVPGMSCGPLTPYTGGTLLAAFNAAGAAANTQIWAGDAVWATVVLSLPSVSRVGEYGTMPGHPTITTSIVRAGFGTLAAGATLGITVLSRDEAEAIGLASLQWFAFPGWFNGPVVDIMASRAGALTINMRGNAPATAIKVVNGAKRVYCDAVFLPQGFADVTGLPPYMLPPPVGVNGVADLLSEQGFRDVVLAAGGPDLFAGPGFAVNIDDYLDYTPNAIVVAAADMVGNVVQNRMTRLAQSEGVAAVTFCGVMAEVGNFRFMMKLRDRMLALGMPVPWTFCINAVSQEWTRVLEAGLVLEYAPHRP